MAQAEGETDARFAAVVQALGRRPGVTHSAAASRRFGSTALKVHDRIFAMVSSEVLCRQAAESASRRPGRRGRRSAVRRKPGPADERVA
jgi:hypothetical protein